MGGSGGGGLPRGLLPPVARSRAEAADGGDGAVGSREHWDLGEMGKKETA